MLKSTSFRYMIRIDKWSKYHKRPAPPVSTKSLRNMTYLKVLRKLVIFYPSMYRNAQISNQLTVTGGLLLAVTFTHCRQRQHSRQPLPQTPLLPSSSSSSRLTARRTLVSVCAVPGQGMLVWASTRSQQGCRARPFQYSRATCRILPGAHPVRLATSCAN